jgi:hypothetical protein
MLGQCFSANVVGLQVHRIASKISGAHRSVMLAAATSGPAAWLMGMLCVVSVIYHNSQLGGVYSPHAERQQYQYMAQLCSTPSLLGQLRCVASLQQQQLHQRGWMLGSVSWATVAAYPGDLGLAAAVFMPQLLLLLLVAKLLASWYARTLDPSGHANADDHDASGRVVGDSSTGHAAADASRPWAVRLLCGSGPTGAAAFLAVAKLLPLVCSFMTVITGWLGLRQQHPAAQALQLMHPATSVAAALMTLLSQASILALHIHATLAERTQCAAQFPVVRGPLLSSLLELARLLLHRSQNGMHACGPCKCPVCLTCHRAQLVHVTRRAH